MPGGDRTGPVGAGPMTGRGAGYCNGFKAGAGMGRGRRNMNNRAGRPAYQVREDFSDEIDKDAEIAELKKSIKKY